MDTWRLKTVAAKGVAAMAHFGDDAMSLIGTENTVC